MGRFPTSPATRSSSSRSWPRTPTRASWRYPSGRYFGFVIGGSLPAALAADWLTSTWDQNAGLVVCGPAAAVVEEVTGEWLKELFGLPSATSFAFVTGCQMAHVTCLAAARHAVLERAGWDVERNGLSGAPPIRVLVGGKRHVTVDRALRLLGLGTASTVSVAVDDQGRMRPDALEAALAGGDGPAIVCAQVGEVNTGAVDAMPEIAALSKAAGAWLHVDGAFGLWAAASPELRHLVEGVGEADSWATDAHKWLNVPYDCGLAFVAHPEAHRAAMAMTAEYLVADPDAARDPDGLDSRVLTPSTRTHGVCGAPLPGQVRRGRARRAVLPARAALRRRARAAARLRDPERGGPEPGAPALRRRRDDACRPRVPCNEAARRG